MSVELAPEAMAKRPRGRPVSRSLPHPLSWEYTPGCSGCEGRSYAHSTLCVRRRATGPSDEELEEEAKRRRSSEAPAGSTAASAPAAGSTAQGEKRDGDASNDMVAYVSSVCYDSTKEINVPMELDPKFD